MKSTQKQNRTSVLAGTAVGIALVVSAYANPADYGETEAECHAYNAMVDEENAPFRAFCNELTEPDRSECHLRGDDWAAEHYHDCGC